MYKQMTAVAVLALVAGTAMAAPRESQSFAGPVNSNSFANAESFTLNFTGSDGGGAYTASRLTIAGTLTSVNAATYASETWIDITPPGGAEFTVQLSPNALTFGTETINADRPIGAAAAPAGTWTFKVYESYDDGADGAVDSTLSDITVTLDDTAFAAGDSQAFPINLGTLVDGTNVTQAVTLLPGSVKWYKATILETSTAVGRKLSVGTLNSTSGDDSEICVYLGDGSNGYISDDYGAGAFSFLSFGRSSTTNVDLAAGDMYIAVGSFNTNWYVDFDTISTGPGGTFQLDVLSEFLGEATAPASTDLGTLVDGTPVTQAVEVPANGVVWYKAVVGECNAGTGRTVRMTTGNSVSADDSEMGLYNSTGVFVATNDDIDLAGGNYFSQLSFGAVGANGDLAAGTYYIAIGTYNTAFNAAGWDVVNQTGAAGSFQLDVEQGMLTGPTPPDATDLGEIGAGEGGTEVVTTVDVAIAPGAITWLKFSTAADALNGTLDYMDIDTNPAGDDGLPTVGSINDNELGLYRVSGTLVAIDDDSAADYHSMLTFGDDVNYRPQIGNGFQGDGFNGDLVAGTYYMAVGCFNSVFAADFVATSTSTAEGTIQVNFRTNIPGGSGPGACSPADVGMAGGEPGQDNLLDNNDFIAFINFFFEPNPIADMGAAGGEPGSDGMYDNNDFIAFINHFFEDVANCNG